MATTRDRLCVTAGRVAPLTHTLLHVEAAGMRPFVAGGHGHAAELDFAYRGPSSSSSPLADGTLRRQIGLKLRARDTCNVVYVMWHIEPTNGINVSVKSNPDLDTHAACGARGYVNVTPTSRKVISPIALGSHHSLRATIQGEGLQVFADGALVWEGVLPPVAFSFDGLAGVRTDNGVFDFELRAFGEEDGATCTFG